MTPSEKLDQLERLHKAALENKLNVAEAWRAAEVRDEAYTKLIAIARAADGMFHGHNGPNKIQEALNALTERK